MKPVRSPVWIIAGTVLITCLLCTSALAATRARFSDRMIGYRVCAGITDYPKFQVGFGWTSDYVARVSPLMFFRYHACVRLPIPYINTLAFGELVFPP